MICASPDSRCAWPEHWLAISDGVPGAVEPAQLPLADIIRRCCRPRGQQLIVALACARSRSGTGGSPRD